MSDDFQSTGSKIVELQSRHRALDEAILALQQRPYQDRLQLQRLKKEKLKIKDWIERLKDDLIPDIDA